MRFVGYILLVLSMAVASAPTNLLASDGYEDLFSDFDARGMTPEEKRLLQAALAFQGLYSGLLDGKWGRASQNAIERYSSANYSLEPLNAHAATLVIEFLSAVENHGWSMTYQPIFDLSFAFPSKALKLAKTSETFRYWTTSDESLELALWKAAPAAYAKYHADLVGESAPDSRIYEARNDGLWVTSLVDRSGRYRYLRSDWSGSDWSMLAITAAESQKNVLNGISTSILLGYAPDFSLPENGRVATIVHRFANWIESQKADTDTATANGRGKPEVKNEEAKGSGSGFFVSRKGHVLTNAHVVQGCSELTVDGSMAVALTSSSDFDLALLLTAPPPDPDMVSRFAGGAARLNEDVTVAGYPLRGLLGGVNVTRGAVTSMKGLMGDLTTMQISAPVQSGNSGGPVLNETGAVVGVVVAKFNAKRYADLAGEIPQNINFAIRGEVAKLFLSSNQVDFLVERNEAPLTPVELARQAQRYTVLIECR